MILGGAAFALGGCQAVLGIDPADRHQSAFCAAAAAYDARCSMTNACDVARVAACAEYQAIVSPGAISAYTACAALEPCSGADASDAGTAYEGCLAASYGAPSALLTTLVGSYCAQCGAQNTLQCSMGPVAQSLATFDDAVLTEIRDTCLPKNAQAEDGGIAESCAGFTRCTNDIVAVADPPPTACNGR
ncbi:MAG: hypothetical protein ABI551_11070 [Polyangiaceae bacterium]